MTEQTDAQQMIELQAQIAEAAAKLQRLKDRERNVTRISREVWDSFSDHQRSLLAESGTKGLTIIEDVWPSEIEVAR